MCSQRRLGERSEVCLTCRGPSISPGTTSKPRQIVLLLATLSVPPTLTSECWRMKPAGKKMSLTRALEKRVSCVKKFSQTQSSPVGPLILRIGCYVWKSRPLTAIYRRFQKIRKRFLPSNSKPPHHVRCLAAREETRHQMRLTESEAGHDVTC